MLIRFTNLRACAIGATDGEIGRVVDLYFDDASWAVRYLVADTGRWLPGRQVLISPAAVSSVDLAGEVLNVGLTREQVKNSPEVDTALPVSRQRESELAAYYGWPVYWTPNPAAWGAGGMPGVPAGDAAGAQPERGTALAEQHDGPQLRSAHEVIHYNIRAIDGDIGRMEDFLVADWEWMIRYLVIDTRKFWSGKAVLIPPHAVREMDWAEARVSVELTRERIQAAPEFDPDAPVDRAYEERLHEHYGWESYWSEE